MCLTWENKARVELSIQSADAGWNKSVFDLLKESREQIEAHLGAELVWERLDENKYSRVRVSRSGSIEDSEEGLDEIRSWMIDHVNRFPTTFRPYLEEVMKQV